MSFGCTVFQFGVDVTLPVLQNLVLWLDAADSINTIAESSDQISQWDDKSGNGNHFVQSDTNSQPTLLFNDQNGLNTVDFLKSNTEFMSVITSAVILSGDTGRTFFYAMYPDQIAGGMGIFTLNQSGDVGARYQVLVNNSDNLSLQVVSGNRSWSNSIQNAFNIVTMRNGENTNVNITEAWLNGTLMSQAGNSSEIINTSSTGITRLGTTAAGSNFMNGQIGEIIVYDRALSVSERETMENYLASKWGT